MHVKTFKSIRKIVRYCHFFNKRNIDILRIWKKKYQKRFPNVKATLAIGVIKVPKKYLFNVYRPNAVKHTWVVFEEEGSRLHIDIDIPDIDTFLTEAHIKRLI